MASLLSPLPIVAISVARSNTDDRPLCRLRSYVEAMGGRLTLVAEFPKRKPVVLSGIAALDADARS